MTRASILSALALSVGLLSLGCGSGTTNTTFADVYAQMNSGGCVKAACHGGASAAMGGKLVNIKAADKASCTVVTTAANGLINTSAPADSRLAKYPFDMNHGGAANNPGWTKASDPGPTAVANWVTAGAICP